MTCTEDVRTGAFWEVSLFKKEEQWQQTTRHGQTRGGATTELWCLCILGVCSIPLITSERVPH